MTEEIGVYIFTAAENADDAWYQVESWLEDNLGREFYSKFDVEQDNIQAVLDMEATYFDSQRSHVEGTLRSQRKDAETANVKGDRNREGTALKVISNILLENMCPSMPWFNSETYDWQVPNNDDEKHLTGNDCWYAVMVKFYY